VFPVLGGGGGAGGGGCCWGRQREVLFLYSVNAVVVSGIVVRGTFVPVVPLAATAVRVTVANVPPFIKRRF